MICAEANALLPELLDGRSAASEHPRLQAHLETCPECCTALAELLELTAQLDQLPEVLPSPELQRRFHRMLEEAGRERRVPWSLGWGRVVQAAGFVLMLGGAFLGGYLVRGGPERSAPPLSPGSALLRQGSEELRLAGIMLTSQGDQEDPAPAAALLQLLEQDPRESVRLAAVDALYMFGRQPQVRERLAATLPRQASPRVQLALVDLLAGLREQRALDALRALLQAPGTSPEVARRLRTRLQEPAL